MEAEGHYYMSETGPAPHELSRIAKEERLHLAEELRARREGDYLRNFKPHTKQQLFIDSTLNGFKKENWFIAANRSGKSDAGAYIGATLARFGRPDGAKWDNPGSAFQVRDRATSGWVSALDFPTARDVIQPKYFNNGYGGGQQPFIPAHEIEKWNVEDQILKLKNGSLIGFKSAESGRSKYQGAAKDWMHMDEEHPWEIYEESVIRVGQKPLIFFCTCTLLPPEGLKITASWVFGQIIQPFLDGIAKHLGVFGASIYDNPAIPREEIKRLESIYPSNSPSRRIRLDGEWLPGIGGARAYASYDRRIHNNPNMPRISQRRPLCWMWDFNVSPMVSLIGQVDGRVYRFYHELILEEGSIPEMCSMFYERIPEHGAEIWLYGDATGEKRVSQTGKSDYWTVMNEMKQYGVPIRMRVPPENPRVPDRINAMNRMLKDEEGTVRIQIDPNCKELCADLEQVLRDNRGGVLKVTNRRDPYFRRTHTSDAAGYWISFEEPVRVQSARSGLSTLPAKILVPQYGTRR
jgi:phage terminase large subunit-like protein